MKFKKIILITLLLLAVLTVSSVNAMENETGIISAEQNNDNTLQINESNNLESVNSESSYSNELNDNEITQATENNLLEMNNTPSNIISSTNKEIFGDSGNSYKLIVQPAKVYSHQKFTYSVKLTKNGEPASGIWVDLSFYDGIYSTTSFGAKTNSKGIANIELPCLDVGKNEICVEVYDYKLDINEYVFSYIQAIKNPKAKTTIKAPKVTAKYKQNKYFKITLKNYKGKPIKNYKLLLIISGKKDKEYTVKTNNKGVAKFNLKKLKPGSYNVYINDGEDVDGANFNKYNIYKASKFIIKKTTQKTSKITLNKKSSSKYKIITTTAKKHWITKKSGNFKVKTKIWDFTVGARADYKYLDTCLYKNGKQLDSTKYLVKYKINGKWTRWTKNGFDNFQHRKSLHDSVKVNQIKVKVKK